MKKEFIVCAAVYIETGKKHPDQPTNIETGFVVGGLRHSNCVLTIELFDTIPEVKKGNMGFLTSHNRFVNRKEAWKIAKENDQIQWGLKASDNGEDSILISENLY